MDQIKELVLSWQMKEAARVVRSDENALDVVIEMLDEDDETLQLRALAVLEDILSNPGDPIRKKVLSRGFDRLLSLLLAADDRVVMRTLLVFKKLVGSVPILESQFSRLLDALYVLASKGKTTWIGILDLVSSFPQGYYSSLDGHIGRFLRSDNIWVSSIGLKIAVTMDYVSEDMLPYIGRVFSGIFEVNDVLLLEVAFDSMIRLLTAPSPAVIEMLLRSSYFRLSLLSTSHEDILIRSRAREVLKLVRSAVLNYYGRRPDDAVELARRLKEEGFTEEAALIEHMLPTYRWNVSTMSILRGNTEKLPRFLREL
jgi:hypothetical protein